MDIKLKEVWVAALRSGKYPQGKSRLNSYGLFCCLGVACEVFVEQGLMPLTVTRRGNFVQYDGAMYSPPHKLSVAIEEGRDFEARSPISVLINMNDAESQSFPEIADWIEANL